MSAERNSPGATVFVEGRLKLQAEQLEGVVAQDVYAALQRAVEEGQHMFPDLGDAFGFVRALIAHGVYVALFQGVGSVVKFVAAIDEINVPHLSR